MICQGAGGVCLSARVDAEGLPILLCPAAGGTGSVDSWLERLQLSQKIPRKLHLPLIPYKIVPLPVPACQTRTKLKRVSVSSAVVILDLPAVPASYLNPTPTQWRSAVEERGPRTFWVDSLVVYGPSNPVIDGRPAKTYERGRVCQNFKYARCCRH